MMMGADNVFALSAFFVLFSTHFPNRQTLFRTMWNLRYFHIEIFFLLLGCELIMF